MNRFVSIVRIFYTTTLILFGLGIFLLQTTSIIGIQHGHGSFTVFWQNTAIGVVLWVLLLASRLLYYRSPKWLWLGVPTIVCILAGIGFVVVGTWLTEQKYQMVNGSERGYTLPVQNIANTPVKITVHPCDSTSTDFCFGSNYSKSGNQGPVQIWQPPDYGVDIYYGVVVAKSDRNHLYIVGVEQTNQPGTDSYNQIRDQIKSELLDGGIVK
ncbi:MAG TPA: hypothetical protein VHD37_02135 [Candidatus Paceibacterota bacterium]|nr:hypothetical protein [Candidatus Paceibacterota bacterium]